MDGICSLDLSGVFRDANPAFETMTGYTSQELTGMTFFDMLCSDDLERACELISLAFQDKVLGNIETELRHKNGAVVNVIYTPAPIVIDHEIVGLFMNVKDITERKRSEEALLKAEKLSTAGHLAAGFAHEIRNPLTAIKGFTQLLAACSADKRKFYSEITLGEIKHIEMIVDDFLTLAKPQKTKFTVRDVRDILQDAISLLEPQALLIGVEIGNQPSPSPAFVLCDDNQVHQVFVNVLKNGVEAVLANGRIVIQTEVQESEIYIRFTDDGIGIPEELLSKLGEPFFTTKEKGTGLGLMMSRMILDNHNGRLEIASTHHFGTTVTVVLPRTQPRG